MHEIPTSTSSQPHHNGGAMKVSFVPVFGLVKDLLKNCRMQMAVGWWR